MTDKEKLKKAYEDIVWMAIRYAHGRQTYAPGMVRDSIKQFQEVFPDWKPRHDRTLKTDKEMLLDAKRHGLYRKSDFLDDLVEDEENN